jgi:hypothetical protein
MQPLTHAQVLAIAQENPINRALLSLTGGQPA